MRPLTLREAEARVSVLATKCVIYGQRARLLIQLQQVQAIFRRVTGGHDEALRARIPCRPMRVIDIAELEPRHFGRLHRSRYVEHDETMDSGHTLNQIMTDDRGNPAPVAGKGEHQLRPRLVIANSGNALHPASERLYEDRSIGAQSRLFRADLGIAILAHIKVRGLEQFEIR